MTLENAIGAYKQHIASHLVGGVAADKAVSDFCESQQAVDSASICMPTPIKTTFLPQVHERPADQVVAAQLSFAVKMLGRQAVIILRDENLLTPEFLFPNEKREAFSGNFKDAAEAPAHVKEAAKVVLDALQASGLAGSVAQAALGRSV